MADVLTEKSASGVMTVTLNRPDAMNSLGGDLPEQFRAALTDARVDPAVRVVVITGTGRAFCAGADLVQAGSNPPPPDQPKSFTRGVNTMIHLHDAFSGAVFRCPKPTLALVNGPAAGAGFGMALACDFRIASSRALFVSAFATIGLAGDNGITWGLSRIVGRARALEILLLSPRIGAEEALALGLVRGVEEPDKLLPAGLDLAERLAAGPVEAFAIMKRNLDFAETATFAESLDREAAGISTTALVGENASAIQAFLEKRPPDFRRR